MLDLIDNYLDGPQLLRKAVAGMSQEQLIARPVPGKWSTLEVICHLADFEIVGADRIKRVIAENEPTLFGGDEKYSPLGWPTISGMPKRNSCSSRRSASRWLGFFARLKPEDFQRRGIHSEAGPLTLEAFVQRSTGHIPHHVRFIEEKRKALAQP